MTDQASTEAGSSASRFDASARVLLYAFCGVLAITLIRVGQLQIAPGQDLQPFVDARTGVYVEPGRRGDVVDRRGRVLATSRVLYQPVLDPETSKSRPDVVIERLANALGERLGEEPESIGERLMAAAARNDAVRAGEIEGAKVRRYMPIGVPLERADAVELLRAKVPGLSLERRQDRMTPGGDLVAAIVGKVGFGHVGLLGAELEYNEELVGDSGRMMYVRDARGRALWMETGSIAPPSRGDDIRLSIDLELQRIAVDELTKGVEAADAAGGRIVALDPGTGEVLAIADVYRDVPGLVEYPWVDPENPEAPRPEYPSGTRYRVLPPDPVRASGGEAAMARLRCVTDVYEPGSVFKSAVWAAALEMDMLPSDEIIKTSAGFPLHGRVLRDVTRQRELSWEDVLAKSSNIGMAMISEKLTDPQLYSIVRRFGFGSTTGVGLAGETAGLVPQVKNWSKLTPSSMAMGHEVAVTAMQAARMMCVFARSGTQAGTLPRLRLTAVGESERVSLVSDRVLSPETALQTRRVLTRVGDAVDTKIATRQPNSPAPRYTLWGKSGTAEIPKTPPKGLARPKGDGYFEDQYVSGFAGGAPLDEPRIVVIVTIDDVGPAQIKKRWHYGSDVAGPVVRRFVEEALRYLGVEPDRQRPELLATAD
ncbi:MAG: penicillin-binding protein 2 [Planctomycetota bacterium]